MPTRTSYALAASLALMTVAPARAAAGKDTDASAYLARIRALDDRGPRLGAVIVTAADTASRAPAAQARGGPLAGLPVLIKDNIETREWPTTAGSLALADNATGRDAPLVARLRAAGAVILGKTNLSEWANIRSDHSTSGWSAVGGQTRNPFATDRDPCGSSSGSAVAVAAGLSWAAIGTETDGSITCPASVNGIVGFKPSVGLVSRTYIVPISHSQDTAGPMATSVADAGRHAADFAAGLDRASLKGARIGVLRGYVGALPAVRTLFAGALADLARAGAVLVDIDWKAPDALGDDEFQVLLYELRQDLGAYLRGLPGNPPVRSLADVIAFDRAHSATELRWFGQETFEAAEKATDAAAYAKARATSLRLAGADGIDKLLADHDVTVLVAPTSAPAWPIDLVAGDHYEGGIGAGSLAAVAGYPHLTVPMGAVEGLPVGLSFIGGKWDDARVLGVGAAYERARTAKLATPTFKPWSGG